MQLLFSLIMVAAAATLPLEHCPSTPNCVSSQATDKHFIKPFPITGEAAETFSLLREILAQRSDTTIVSADAKMIRVEFRTALGFVDDGQFVLDTEHDVIHLRSASRKGYWDFGKNRRRLEEIRRHLTGSR